MTGDARSLIEQARTTRQGGDAAGSLALYRQAADACHNDDQSRAHCLRHIGDLARVAGLREEARAALSEAERLYRGPVTDRLSLANTVRLRALLDGGSTLWREARRLYEDAGRATGLDMSAAFYECDRHLADVA